MVTKVCQLSLPGKKMKMIKNEIQQSLKKDFITLRELASIIGLLSSSVQAIFPEPLHYRALQRLKGDALRKGLWYGNRVAWKELCWWRHGMGEQFLE